MIVSQLMRSPPCRRDKEQGASVQVHVNLLVGGTAGDSAVSCVLVAVPCVFAGVWG